jgi:hypothetical protein
VFYKKTAKMPHKQLKNFSFCILLFALMLNLACTKFKTEQLHGTWNFVSIKNEKGKKLSIRPEIELDFDTKGSYEYSSIVKNEQYAETGVFYLQSDLIVLKNSDTEAPVKQIKIIQLSRDTMQLKMKNIANDIQFLTLYKSKIQKIETDSLETENEDLEEKVSNQSVKRKKK